MGTEAIFDNNCKHDWVERACKNPLTNKIIASWETCTKCGSERR